MPGDRGNTTGSYSQSPAKVPGRRISANNSAAPPRVADGLHLGDPEVVDDGEHVVDHAIPGEVHRRGRRAVAVAAEVERPAVGHVRQVPGQRCPDHPVEPRGVAEQQRRTVAAEVDGAA